MRWNEKKTRKRTILRSQKYEEYYHSKVSYKTSSKVNSKQTIFRLKCGVKKCDVMKKKIEKEWYLDSRNI